MPWKVTTVDVEACALQKYDLSFPILALQSQYNCVAVALIGNQVLVFRDVVFRTLDSLNQLIAAWGFAISRILITTHTYGCCCFCLLLCKSQLNAPIVIYELACSSCLCIAKCKMYINSIFFGHNHYYCYYLKSFSGLCCMSFGWIQMATSLTHTLSLTHTHIRTKNHSQFTCTAAATTTRTHHQHH